jgi:hypothetical protein
MIVNEDERRDNMELARRGYEIGVVPIEACVTPPLGVP